MKLVKDLSNIEATRSQPKDPEQPRKRLGQEERGVARAAGVISLGTLVSRITGLIRDMVLGDLFGARSAADAYYVAFRIPSLLRELFAEGSMSAAFIPVFTEYLTNRTKGEARELARSAMTILLILVSAAVGIGILASRQIVGVMARGFAANPEKFNLTVSLIQVMFPYLLMISLSALAMGILNSCRRFGPPAFSSAVFNVASIATVLISARFFEHPIMAAALGVTVGGFAQFAWQIPALQKSAMLPARSRPLSLQWPIHPGVKKMGRLIVPTLIGLSVAQVNILVNTLLATFLREGSVSYLYFGMRLIHFPLGMFGVALATALLPTLSAQAARRSFSEMSQTISFGLRLIFYITLPATVGLICFRYPIIHLLFEHGRFGPAATEGTAEAVLFYAAGLWAFAGVRVVVPAFYSLQDTRTPVRIGILAMLVNIALSLILMVPLGHGGLALAASLSSAVNFTLLLWVLRKRVGHMDGTRIVRSFTKIILASAIVALPSLWINHQPIWGQPSGWMIKSLLLSTAIGSAVVAYGLVHYLLRSEEQEFLFHMLKEKLLRS